MAAGDGTRVWIRVHAVLIALVAGATLLSLPADAAGPRSAVVSVAAPAAAPQVPPGCRPTRNPPPTEYGFVARIEEGSIDAGVLKVEDMDVSVCGVLRLVSSPPGSPCPVSSELRIPADGVKVNTVRAVFDIIPGNPLVVPVSMQARPTASLVSCEGDSSDGFKAELTVALEGRAGLFGLECALPFTGVATSVITGPMLSPPYEGQATLKGTDFTVGRVANHDKFCPGTLPERIDGLAGLPITKVPIDLTAKIAVYQDAL
ncbi:hypothetical protein [Nocardioides sp. L-11A]|uniref:hypothetical protein n=1 Tax=Nocardioides sp. L-11A TaxID=3043848 RepID=UPI00249CC2BD|nr:hypothetical protein QJ852_17045 [Nocardioides sp. L-11A]